MKQEVIERKGPGHPDTICDTLAEVLGKNLKALYKSHYGECKHYNVDKVLASCGEVNYKKGVMTKPVKIVFSGNATKVEGLNELLRNVVDKVLQKEINNGFKYKIYNHISLCSPDLTSNFNKRKANDTSFSVGSPLTQNEKLVLKIGKYIEKLSTENPFVGTDYKIMFVNGKITIALAMISGDFDNNYTYQQCKMAVKDAVEKKFKINIKLNTADNREQCFNTITGTSLEQGDAGMVGRGNRYNGLITPMQPMTMEAYCGKNDVTHIGKIYQKRAFELAQKTKKRILMVNDIGESINKPKIIKW